MNRIIPLFFGVLFLLLLISFQSFHFSDEKRAMMDSLRTAYLRSPDKWPAPHTDPGVVFEELGQLLPSPYDVDSLKPLAELGKVLFHDPRLSGSNQISCGSCHVSDLHWTDGRRVSLGHDHKNTDRNTPSLENVWQQKSYFWDGRAKTLESQALISISSPLEMNQKPEELPQKLILVNGYLSLFKSVFGDSDITLERIVHALATYQRTITSRKSKFDDFIAGASQSLNDQQVLGLHLFRTKARCINCHHGPFFTDHQFHNVGLTYYRRERYEDLGRYNFTQNPEDVGKFKTPSLRNVMHTYPWFHNGIFGNIDGVMNMYNVGMPRVKPKEDQKNDPLFPKTSPLLKALGLTQEEKDAIVAFLESLSSMPHRVDQPKLPQ